MPQNRSAHLSPQMAIRLAIKQAITKLYGPQDVSVRVVRQHRDLRIGSLEFIDYAVPCFELARLVGAQAETVAADLVKELEARRGTADESLWRYEAVAGYINIQLSIEYLEQAVEAVGQWLKNPERAPYEDADTYLLVGMDPNEPTEGGKLSLEAYRHIAQAYEALGAKHMAVCILSDFSEKMPHYLSGKIIEKDTRLVGDMKEHARLHQNTRKFLADPSNLDDASPIKQTFGQVHTAMLATYEGTLRELGVEPYELVPESTIIGQAHACIDGLDAKVGEEGFIKDEASRAMYYAQDDKIIALRSAEGMLYGAAYILSELHDRLLQNAAKPRALIIFAPNSLHRLITSYADMLRRQDASTGPIIFFDPHVSRADIFQLQSSIPSLAEHFQNISRLLAGTRSEWLNQTKTRQSLLSFVDLPEMLSGAVEVVQLPVLFDTISESAEVLQRFSD